MEKKNNRLAKEWRVRYALILCLVIIGTVTLSAIIGLLLGIGLDVFNKKPQEILEKTQKNLQRISTFEIYENVKEHPDLLEGSNLDYMIYEGNKSEAEEALKILSDEDNKDSASSEKYEECKNKIYYISSGFEKSIPQKAEWIEEFPTSTVNDKAVIVDNLSEGYESCYYRTNLFYSLFSKGLHYYSTKDLYKSCTAKVSEVVRNPEDGLFYYLCLGNSKKYAFPVHEIDVIAGSGTKNSAAKKYILSKADDDTYVYGCKNNLTDILDTKAILDKENTYLRFDKEISVSEKNIVENPQTKINRYRALSDEIKENEEESSSEKKWSLRVKEQNHLSDKFTAVITYRDEKNRDQYGLTILTRVAPEFVKERTERFYEQRQIVNFLTHFKWLLLVQSILGFIVCVGLLWIVCDGKIAEAKQNLSDGKAKNWWYYIPTESTLVAIIIFDVMMIWMTEENILPLWDIGVVPIVAETLTLLFFACGIWANIYLILDICARAAYGVFWKNTMAGYSLRAMKKAWGQFEKNVSLVVIISVILMILAMLQFIALVTFSDDTGALLSAWLCYKVIETIFVIKFFIQLNKLHKKAAAMAQGDLDTKLDTKGMLPATRRHGEYLNGISDGMEKAVQKQMKSERFRTELITNVSHDIKTPLTSIINYVDLMKKEKIAEEKVKEYLEVLDRQSGKLKKLIEDLIEASKASTGNLKVELEKCDVDILLTQVVGEFEERLKQSQLELVVQKPEREMIINADNRHLWRVFDNLIVNVCKYAMPGTRVYVNLEESNGAVKISMLNISRESLNISSEELMERFVRGDSSRNTEGSGLGLSIASDLCKLMNGQLRLKIDGDLFKAELIFPEES